MTCPHTAKITVLGNKSLAESASLFAKIVDSASASARVCPAKRRSLIERAMAPANAPEIELAVAADEPAVAADESEEDYFDKKVLKALRQLEEDKKDEEDTEAERRPPSLPLDHPNPETAATAAAGLVEVGEAVLRRGDVSQHMRHVAPWVSRMNVDSKAREKGKGN